MTNSPYETDLDRNPANFQPLTPLTLLERAASVFPDHPAVVHGPLRRSYRELYARTRRLASALKKRNEGIDYCIVGEPSSVVALLSSVYLAPGVVLALFAGGFVDRSHKRRLLIAADLLPAGFAHRAVTAA